MPARLMTLMLDSLAIGVVASTLILESILILGSGGMSATLAGLGPALLGLLWVKLAMTCAPFATMALLAVQADRGDD
jgi:hypothetical protein